MPAILGAITLLQVQRSALKVGGKGARRYHTDPIVGVGRLRVTYEGVVGLTPDGEVLDAHHREHPLHKNDDGRHGVSIGFTRHYRVMQAQFGPHLHVGCAGENIIVETEQRLGLTDVEAGLLVLDGAGREKGRFSLLEVARPCKAFTGFAHRHATVPAETFRQSLQFLDGGLRGFYATWAGEPAVLEVGDLLAGRR